MDAWAFYDKINSRAGGNCLGLILVKISHFDEGPQGQETMYTHFKLVALHQNIDIKEKCNKRLYYTQVEKVGLSLVGSIATPKNTLAEIIIPISLNKNKTKQKY